MRHPRRTLLGVATALLVSSAPVVYVSTATPALAAPTVQICQARAAASLCLNRKGGGRANGTPIIGWSAGDNNNSFFRQQLKNMCNSGWVAVYANGGCPFPVGSGLNSKYKDAAIVSEEQGDLGPGDFAGCVGSTQTFSAAILTNCPDNSGNNGGWGTIMILPQVKCCNFAADGDKISYTVNRYWSGVANAARWQCVYARGNQVNLSQATGDAGYCEWREA
jgi:hypothetical protein